jgi:general stress protein 26
VTAEPPVATEVHDYEDVTAYGLDDAEERDLLVRQNECTFVWATRDGWPVGVTMSYVWHDGRVWLTTSSQRKRVAAVRRDQRVSVIVSSTGTDLGPGRTVTLKGRCTVHDERDVIDWFLPALAQAVFPDQPGRQEKFARLLDSPRRVVLEVVPEGRITHDVGKLSQAVRATRPPSATEATGP